MKVKRLIALGLSALLINSFAYADDATSSPSNIGGMNNSISDTNGSASTDSSLPSDPNASLPSSDTSPSGSVNTGSDDASADTATGDDDY